MTKISDEMIEFGENVLKRLLAGKGRLTIQEFNVVEKLVRPYMRAKGLRCFYRGPRISNNCCGVPSMTRRCDAKFVVFGAK